jgi:glycerol-3-phosphate dehydrogenase (NAD(P)+)
MQLDRVAVIGAGAWGTALAQVAAIAGRQVTIVGRDPAVIDEINRNHRNTPHLPGVNLRPGIVAASVLPDTDLVILAVPAQATRDALRALDGRIGGKPTVLTAKGIEHGTLDRQSQILADIAPAAVPYVLSGPSFAADVAAGRPTAVTFAGDDPEQTAEVAAALAGPTFRLYAADDRVGVELAGALKNVYALGCGAVDGAGLMSRPLKREED